MARSPLLFLLSLGIISNILVNVLPVRSQSGELLKGTIQEQGYIPPSTDSFSGEESPGLTRKDIPVNKSNKGDPFASSDTSETPINEPATNFHTALVTPPAGFNLNANKNGRTDGSSGGYGKFKGTAGPGKFDATNHSGPPQDTAGPPRATVSPEQDPDTSPEMQLAWDAWHKRVAAAIFQKFEFFASSAFKYSRPLVMRVSYLVTRDGNIQNISVVQPSGNPMFDMLVNQCIKSLNGNQQLLQFPQGSRRLAVDKFGTFMQNYSVDGQVIKGFRYATGDKELVPASQ